MNADNSDNQMSELEQYNDTIRYFVQTHLTDQEGNLLRPKISTVRIVSVYVLWLVPTIVACVLLRFFFSIVPVVLADCFVSYHFVDVHICEENSFQFYSVVAEIRA